MASRKVLLVGWDAADWKVIHPLMASGKMPNVERLVKNGAHGQIATLHPPLSPMLWTSIATGKRPFQHGILGFSEPSPDGRGVQPVSNLSRKAKALWNILTQNDLRSVVIGWWPSHPAEPIRGVMVSDHYHRAQGPLERGWPLRANSVHPPELAKTLAGLRVHPDSLTPDMVESFIPLASEIDQDGDKRLAHFLRTLAEGMSIQAAARWLIENQAWDFFAVYFEALDHFCHGFMRFHPPRQPWVSERDFELYRGVVSMAYQLHDRMLGELLEKAGGDATVILMSDHGFHPDHLRPSAIPEVPAGPAIEHRDFGVLAIAGPGVRRDTPLHGASVLDIAPTVLALFGLPVGKDMDGKVLAGLFAETPQVHFVSSWEEVRGADGRHPPHTRVDPVAAQEAMDQMIALGYIERPDEEREIAIARTVRELRFNLAQAYQDADRHAEAHEILSELCAAYPDEQRFTVRRFVSCQALGLHEEMRRIVEDLDGRRREIEALPDGSRLRSMSRFQPTLVDYLKAEVLIVDKRFADALQLLERVTSAQLIRPGLFLKMAELYLKLRRWREARKVYERALEIDPDNVQAMIGLSRMALRRRKYADAADLALGAVQRDYQNPMAHFLLGEALRGREDYERAADAFRAAISFNPNFPEAHLRLAGLLEKRLGDIESACEHRRLARTMRRGDASGALILDAAPLDETSVASQHSEMPLGESVIVVTGLPRSGTSMLMQMLAAGGVQILTDNLREADEDNPRGYLEYEPVKTLLKESGWLHDARGRAVKIVLPLLAALPAGLACRVILCERDLEEVLDSQEQMLFRRGQAATTPERRQLVKGEYARSLVRMKAMLRRRPRTDLLVIQHSAAIFDAARTAQRISDFLGGGMDVVKMAAVVDVNLYRNRVRKQVTSG